MNRNLLKTVKVNILTELPMSCFNCSNCKEREDNQLLYDCVANNSIVTINTEQENALLSSMLLCGGDDWQMDLEFAKEIISENGIFSVENISLATL